MSNKIKNLTVPINEKKLIDELEAIKKEFKIKTDTKAIKFLIGYFRERENNYNQLISENNRLILELDKERLIRKSFTDSLSNYLLN
ncbi:MAG: hypothetical protein KZQ70_12195 [gamma proteobacterium symbiont of Lucinoma myriamae]|nr:hypothetical protein [gamma proteobacterium symbiont of Lucinoma myriamae]MCU7818732.1 hypothetical protein [gamma proteobacterium symbiont of Lucinoma myriamae]